MQPLQRGQRVRILQPGLSVQPGQAALGIVRALDRSTQMVTVTLETGLPGQTIVVPRARLVPASSALDTESERKAIEQQFTPRERERLEFANWLVLTGRLVD
jgi:hypothetical protein